MLTTIILTILGMVLVTWYGVRQRAKGMDEGSLLLAMAFVKFCQQKNLDVNTSLQELRSCIQLVNAKDLEQE